MNLFQSASCLFQECFKQSQDIISLVSHKCSYKQRRPLYLISEVLTFSAFYSIMSKTQKKRHIFTDYGWNIIQYYYLSANYFLNQKIYSFDSKMSEDGDWFVRATLLNTKIFNYIHVGYVTKQKQQILPFEKLEPVLQWCLEKLPTIIKIWKLLGHLLWIEQSIWLFNIIYIILIKNTIVDTLVLSNADSGLLMQNTWNKINNNNKKFIAFSMQWIAH